LYRIHSLLYHKTNTL